jgi:hypothetical protein
MGVTLMLSFALGIVWPLRGNVSVQLGRKQHDGGRQQPLRNTSEHNFI